MTPTTQRRPAATIRALVFVARRWAQRYARTSAALLFAVVVGLATPEDFAARYASLVVLPPLVALVLGGRISIVVSGALTVALLLGRAGLGGVYADPIRLSVYAVVLGGLVLTRTIFDTTQETIRRTSQDLRDDLGLRRAMKSRLEEVLRGISDGVVTVDKNGAIAFFSIGAERIFGYSADEVLGQPVGSLVPERLRDLHLAHEQRFLRQDGTARHMGRPGELTGRRKGGEEFPIEATISRAGTDPDVLVTVIVRDLSERRAAERQRAELEERLGRAQRMESLGQLAGGAAHDFNNLVGVILNYASVLSEELADHPRLRADVDEIAAAARRATDLTRQLLLFSRREAARLELLDVSEVVEGVHALIARAVGEGVEIVVAKGPGPCPIRADHGQIEQVILNLAVNARDAMPKGGRLTISTSVVDLDQAEAEALQEGIVAGRYVRLTVADTGTGMSPEVARRAFEPFYTTKPAGVGTGLGLATVYGIVTEAGGAVTIGSELGRGTVMTIHFPCVVEPAGAGAHQRVRGPER